MTTPPVFQIRHLACAYRANQPVLRLRHIDIPSGKLVFIIGKSGIGKSTLIETLGLMNRTIAPAPETSIRFDGSENAAAVELRDHWQLPNRQLSDFRRRHFSFIFQNTNLMPNFTSGENMAISLLIRGYTMAEAKTEILSVMDRLSLDRSIFDKKTTEISGGQRQRLAFVRAITADFTVLFGDEPTGNLDRNTSEELMSILRERIQSKGKTGIIVSHDLYLAEKFADIVVPITPESVGEETYVGNILSENVIQRRATGHWQRTDGEVLPNPVAFLNQFLTGQQIPSIT